MSSRRIVATPSAPAAIGAYSQAVVGGGLVHCSGQIPIDPATGQLTGGDVTAQTERVLANLKAVLEAAGSSFARILKCQVFLKDLSDFEAVNAVYARAFEGLEPPARACVEVSRLPKDVDVEIDCVALCD
jgi:2-iminobutanoate/2-iminopropanoate deaminase